MTTALEPQQIQSTAIVPVFDAATVDEPAADQRWCVLVHNDDVTPFDYVMRILTGIFLLSDELAEHVAQTAHDDGTAVVVIRPRAEAERLVKVARARARLDGYPLTFSLEPEH